MPSTYFAENLGFLLTSRGVNQQVIADLVGIAKQTVSGYKNKKSEPSFDIMVSICDFFDVSIDTMLKVDLSKRFIEVGGQQYFLEQQKNYLVPARAQAGTTLEWSQEVLNRFERVHIPGVYGEARTWEVQGDSMEPLIFDGDYVTGKRASMSEFVPGGVCVVITRTQGVHIKKVEWNDSGGVLLIPANPKHQPYVLPLEEVREIWYTQLKITKLVMRPTFLDGGKQPVFPVVRVERDKDQQ